MNREETSSVATPVPVQARRLLRAARAGTLATAAEGQPFASLVTPATAPDGSVLLLLSDLSEHTRHLRADGRCALMVVGTPVDANPQTAPRLTLTGQADIDPDPALKARWVGVHPYAAFYADFTDFNLWRLRPTGGALIGGFARAYRLQPADLLADSTVCLAVSAAEAGVIAHCNADHPDALDAIAAAAGHAGPGWRMVACDVDGFDLAREDHVARIDWPAAVDSPGAIRSALIQLVSLAKRTA
jgi:hypothetical protein